MTAELLFGLAFATVAGAGLAALLLAMGAAAMGFIGPSEQVITLRVQLEPIEIDPVELIIMHTNERPPRHSHSDDEELP